jgi:MarR family
MRDQGLAAPERYNIKLIMSKLMNGTAVESNAPTLGFLLHEVARLLRRRFEQNARDFGLTRSQWQVLAYLANNEGINQSGLADLLEIEPITLGRIVDRLQARGLIERHPDPSDRRGSGSFISRSLPVQNCRSYAGSARLPAAKRLPKFRKPTPSAC